MRDAVICFCDSANAGPDLAALGNEVIIRVDHHKRRERLVIGYLGHAPSKLSGRPARGAQLDAQRGPFAPPLTWQFEPVCAQYIGHYPDSSGKRGLSTVARRVSVQAEGKLHPARTAWRSSSHQISRN